MSVVPPEEALSFTLSSLASWVSISVKEAIMDLKAQIMHMTGEDDPLIVFELSPSMMAKVQAAWQPYVVEFQRRQAAGRRAIKQTTVLAPSSSPSKENENENENGKKRESVSFSSPPRVAPPELSGSGERRVSRLHAPLPSLTSTPPPRPLPSLFQANPACSLSLTRRLLLCRSLSNFRQPPRRPLRPCRGCLTS